MLTDGDLTLRPLTEDDLPAMYAEKIDVPTHELSDAEPLLPLTWEHWRQRFLAKPVGPDVERFTITLDGRQVGSCQLVAFDHLARSAEVGIGLAAPERGRHIGRRALRLLVAHGFRDRGLNRIWLQTLAINEAGLRAYRAVGFVEETRERELSWVDGRYVDEVKMGLLRREWEEAADADR